MGVYYGPTSKIVDSGLVLYLDAANPISYPGSGNDWYDLSGNRFHMSLKNSPTFVSNGNLKYFDLDGVNDYGVCDGTVSGSVEATVSNLGIGGTNQKTVICIANVRNNGSSTTPDIGALFTIGNPDGTDGKEYGLRLNGGYTSWRAQMWGSPDYDFSYDTIDSWTMFTTLYGDDKIGKTYGNNATLLGQDSAAFDLVTAGTKPFTMGTWLGSDFFGGRIALYMVYNKALTAAEISQNFNALRGRFGI